MNIWEDDDNNENDNDIEIQDQNNNQIESGTKKVLENAIDDEKPKILKKKDEKLLDQIRDQGKKLKSSLETKQLDNIIEIHQKLVDLYPQVENIFQGKETPKIYSKSLYLIHKLLSTQDEEIKKTQRKFYNKLKTILEYEKEEIKNIIEDYEVDKTSDDELILDEPAPEDSLIQDSNVEINNNNDEENHFDQQNLDSNDPQVRRRKWMKKEYKMGFQGIQDNQSILATNMKSQNQSQVNETLSTGKISVKDSNKEDKIKKILKRLDKEEIAEELSDEMIEKEYSEKLQLLGQQYKPPEIIERLEFLVLCAKNKGLRLKVCILLISMVFEQKNTQELSILNWRKILNYLIEINILTEEIFLEIKTQKENVINNINLDDPNVDTQEKENKDGFEVKEDDDIIKGNSPLRQFQGQIINFFDNLQQELYKSLQITEYSNSEYLERLKDEIKLIKCLLVYLNNILIEYQQNSNIKPRLAKHLLLSIYFRKSNSISAILDLWRKDQKAIDLSLNKELNRENIWRSPEELIEYLIFEVQSKLDNKAKIKALIYEIYYYSLNENFEYAQDLFIKSNLHDLSLLTKEDIDKYNYNRAVVQLGLCAFKCGKFDLSKHYLTPICSLGTSRLRDCLGQTSEKFRELDKDEKRKLIPYTMSLNIEEVETAFYLSILIEDLDKVLLHRLGIKSNNLYLKKQMDMFEKQVKKYINFNLFKEFLRVT